MLNKKSRRRDLFSCFFFLSSFHIYETPSFLGTEGCNKEFAICLLANPCLEKKLARRTAKTNSVINKENQRSLQTARGRKKTQPTVDRQLFLQCSHCVWTAPSHFSCELATHATFAYCPIRPLLHTVPSCTGASGHFLPACTINFRLARRLRAN